MSPPFTIAHTQTMYVMSFTLQLPRSTAPPALSLSLSLSLAFIFLLFYLLFYRFFADPYLLFLHVPDDPVMISSERAPATQSKAVVFTSRVSSTAAAAAPLCHSSLRGVL